MAQAWLGSEWWPAAEGPQGNAGGAGGAGGAPISAHCTGGGAGGRGRGTLLPAASGEDEQGRARPARGQRQHVRISAVTGGILSKVRPDPGMGRVFAAAVLLGLLTGSGALHAEDTGGRARAGCPCQEGPWGQKAAQYLRGGQGWKMPLFASGGLCTLCLGVRTSALRVNHRMSAHTGEEGRPALRGGSTYPLLSGEIAPSLSKSSKLPGPGTGGHDKWPLLLSPARMLALFLSAVPMVVRYSISCALANILYFGLYRLLLESISSAGLCVNLAYVASVVWQHALHRLLVYGKALELNALYFKELAGVYVAYGLAFILNPIITEACIAMGKVLCAPFFGGLGKGREARVAC